MKIIILLLLNSFFSAFALFGQQYEMVHDIRDNKIYRTVIIGNLAWMAENLNFETDTGSWCYDESNANCQKYGRLYNFETAQNVCMNGWRLPSREEMDSLLLLLKNSENGFLTISSGGSSGFNALSGGWRGVNENYYNIGGQARFWTSSTRMGLNAWYLGVDTVSEQMKTDYDNRELGLSVRCVRKKQ